MNTDIVGTSGLPALLTELLSAVNLDAIEYSGRANDVELLNDALSQGDHSMAETWAKRMITRQQQYRHAQKHGLPSHLQALIDQVNAEEIGYSGRANDVELLNDALSQGDNSMAETWAKRMITRQQQYRHAQEHGLPSRLQALIDQVSAEEIGYSGRANDVELLNDALSQGDNSMAETWAKRMIERQRNIHARKTNTTQSN